MTVRSFGNAALMRGAIAGVLYGAWGAAEAYIFPLSANMSENHFEALVRLLMTVIPAALLLFRCGVVSALALTGIALMNLSSVFIGWQAGDASFGLSSVIFNFVFAAIFARSAVVAVQLRRAASQVEA